MNKRVSQSTAVNRKQVAVDDRVVERCWNCPRYHGRACTATGKMVDYPISGPLPDFCPMPAVGWAEE